MIRFCVLVFVLLSFPAIYAQIIRGTVLNENEIGLKEVSVYVDASAIGTSTDASGRFSLNLSNLKTGNLVIKKNGYKTIIYPFSSDKLKPLKIILTKETAIEEVKLLHFSDKNYNRYINRFLNEFLGFERENVTIKNPKDITFAYDRENKILKAKAKNTLIIENKKLGYYVEYNLINFSIDDGLKMSSYSGTSLFKEMRGGKTKQLEWQANRLNAYYGSAMHFFRSAFNHRVNDEGFIVNHIVEIPNPKYPSKEELQKSEEYFRSLKNKNDGKNPFVVSKEIQEIEWRKRNESEFSLALVEHKIASEKFITKDIHGTFFAFKDLLGIVYQKFPFNINKGVITKATIPINTSSIINTYGNIFELSEDGNYTNPDQMIFMDDWAKQKFSTLLPLDYTPDR